MNLFKNKQVINYRINSDKRKSFAGDDNTALMDYMWDDLDTSKDVCFQAAILTGDTITDVMIKDDIARAKSNLLIKLHDKHGDKPTPAGNRKSLEDSFTVESKRVILWYNIGKFTYTLTERI